jgi:hypothetical protein
VQVLGLMWRPFDYKQTTSADIGGPVIEGMLARRRGQGRACERMPTYHLGRRIKQQENSKKKIHLALDGRRSKIAHTTINQKHAGMADSVLERRCNRG